MASATIASPNTIATVPMVLVVEASERRIQ
jgi:hypothetical protein